MSIHDDPDESQGAASAHDCELILRMKETPNLYTKLALSIAPTIAPASCQICGRPWVWF